MCSLLNKRRFFVHSLKHETPMDIGSDKISIREFFSAARTEIFQSRRCRRVVFLLFHEVKSIFNERIYCWQVEWHQSSKLLLLVVVLLIRLGKKANSLEMRQRFVFLSRYRNNSNLFLRLFEIIFLRNKTSELQKKRLSDQLSRCIDMIFMLLLLPIIFSELIKEYRPIKRQETNESSKKKNSK